MLDTCKGVKPDVVEDWMICKRCNEFTCCRKCTGEHADVHDLAALTRRWNMEKDDQNRKAAERVAKAAKEEQASSLASEQF